ncbi:MAG: MMPL family transporter, partial [Myxococcota bacterium]
TASGISTPPTEVNSITTILPQILIAIGVADSVHVLTSHYRGLRRGMEKRQAAIYALTKNFIPTLLTSISTAIGFFAFSTADLKPISGLGTVAGIGTLYAWFMTYFLMGPLMALAPSFVKPRAEKESLDTPTPFAWKVTELIERYRYPIVAVFSVACVTAVFLASQIRINADPYKYFARGYALRDAQDFVLANLGGVPNFETMIDSGKDDGIKDPEFLKKVEELEREVVAEIDGINRSISIVDILRQTNRSLNGGGDDFYKLPDDRETIAQEKFLYEMSLPQGRDINSQVTIRNDALRITFVSTLSDSSTWVDVKADIERRAEAKGLNALVTGKSSLGDCSSVASVRPPGGKSRRTPRGAD